MPGSPHKKLSAPLYYALDISSTPLPPMSRSINDNFFNEVVDEGLILLLNAMNNRDAEKSKLSRYS